MNDELTWIEPWWHLNENEEVRASIQKELDSEIGPKHPLWQLKPLVIAKTDANDDVIVKLNDGRFACVHLVWHGKIDQYPDKYPSSLLFDTAESLQTYLDEEAKEYT